MQEINTSIEKCKILIEKKLGWGPGNEWQSQDFENLSRKILDATGTQLSISTLKRLWGRARYDSSPNLSTLNAMAKFIGFEDWRAFIFQLPSAPIKNDTAKVQEKTTARSVNNNLRNSKIFWLTMALFLLTGIYFISKKNKYKKTLVLNNVIFRSRPLTQALPNTVIFDYDVSKTNADSVFIQQSWDARLRKKVDKEQKQFACIYYIPGYYKAKLILNDSIVKEHDVFIESQNWTGIIEKMPMPVYLPKNKFDNKEIFSISQADVLAQGFDLLKEIPWLCITKVDKNLAVPGDNFFMDVEVKNTFNKGAGICQHSRIDLLGTNDLISIPLSTMGCIGELKLPEDGGVKDVSLFGVNFSDWVQVHCEVKNRISSIYINHRLAYQHKQISDIGSVIGVRISFVGSGEMRGFELRKF